MRKRFILIAVLALVLGFAAMAFAQPEWSIPTAEKDDDAICLTGRGYFFEISVVTDGSNAVTVDIYDNTAASGTKLIPTWVITTSSTDRAQSYTAPAPIRVVNGIYVDVTCSGTVKYIVYWNK